MFLVPMDAARASRCRRCTRCRASARTSPSTATCGCPTRWRIGEVDGGWRVMMRRAPGRALDRVLARISQRSSSTPRPGRASRRAPTAPRDRRPRRAAPPRPGRHRARGRAAAPAAQHLDGGGRHRARGRGPDVEAVQHRGARAPRRGPDRADRPRRAAQLLRPDRAPGAAGSSTCSASRSAPPSTPAPARSSATSSPSAASASPADHGSRRRRMIRRRSRCQHRSAVTRWRSAAEKQRYGLDCDSSMPDHQSLKDTSKESRSLNS